MISYFSEYNPSKGKFVLKDKKKISSWIKEIIASYGKRVGDINYILADDDYILDINRQYLGHDYYTDIITFDTNEYEGESESRKDIISGDIFISVDTVRANSEEYKVTFHDELLRVLIHGILHLVGFDDHEENDIAQMRNAENQAINLYKEKYEI